MAFTNISILVWIHVITLPIFEDESTADVVDYQKSGHRRHRFVGVLGS